LDHSRQLWRQTIHATIHHNSQDHAERHLKRVKIQMPLGLFFGTSSGDFMGETKHLYLANWIQSPGFVRSPK
jgi:hypothetical protein